MICTCCFLCSLQYQFHIIHDNNMVQCVHRASSLEVWSRRGLYRGLLQPVHPCSLYTVGRPLVSAAKAGIHPCCWHWTFFSELAVGCAGGGWALWRLMDRGWSLWPTTNTTDNSSYSACPGYGRRSGVDRGRCCSGVFLYVLCVCKIHKSPQIRLYSVIWQDTEGCKAHGKMCIEQWVWHNPGFIQNYGTRAELRPKPFENLLMPWPRISPQALLHFQTHTFLKLISMPWTR